MCAILYWPLLKIACVITPVSSLIRPSRSTVSTFDLHSQRAAVWMSVSGAEQARQRDPRRYETLTRSQRPAPTEAAETGEAATEASGASADAALELIDVDLCRTFPDNIYFSAETADDQKSLVSISSEPISGIVPGFQVK